MSTKNRFIVKKKKSILQTNYPQMLLYVRKRREKQRKLRNQCIKARGKLLVATWPDSVNVDELKSTVCLPMSLPLPLTVYSQAVRHLSHRLQPRDRPVYIVVQLGHHRFGTGGSSRRFASLLDSRRNCDGICVIFH